MYVDAYERDLAYIHDRGFGALARRSAPGLLQLFRQHRITEGRVVDLGCGSGIWAKELTDAGYQTLGVDISPAMIEPARRRVPNTEFHVGSFIEFRVPPCRAITALGEVFNYLFDPKNSLRTLQQVFKRMFDSLTPTGLLVFDVAELGRCKCTQATVHRRGRLDLPGGFPSRRCQAAVDAPHRLLSQGW
ncbi:MAG TPA: class I SAM-dependent methyltransferase [Gemmataceae bacterium]|nr:class I SAM-dependent methyltransferase [Gemmataceae bacterium]